MRKIYSLVIVALLIMATNISFGQSTQISVYPFSTKAILGAQCSGGQIHDDGVAENGYGWNASAGDPSAFCTKFIPTVYPYKFTKYCIALTRLSTGVANWNFKIVMWKSVNGMPGPIMDSTSVTATAVPVWPTVSFYDFVLPGTWAQVTGTDSVFIGISFAATTQTGVFVASDESTSTPSWPGFATTAAGPWQNPTALWSGYRAFLQRAEGQAAVTFTHDYSVPNFLSLPSSWVKNTAYSVKAKVQNFGTSAETSVPIKFFVNGVLTGTPINKSLVAGGIDSVSFPWTPTTAGAYNLKIASALTTDEYRGNDTASINITVLPGAVQTIFCDDFTATSNWTLTTAGGTVPWASIAAYSRYTMPVTAIAPGLGCDVDLAGSGNSSNSIATLTTGLNCTGKTQIYLTFDHDWYALSTSDHAMVELSVDGGTTWSTLADWTASHRNSTETIQLPTAENKPSVKLRFTAIQPSWDWWWIVDNVCVKGYIADGTGNNSTIPYTYSLSQNYPNPFNPTTAINYSVKNNGFVTLKVYDMLGKEVASLVNEVKAAGNYMIDFNASNLSTGVYYYKMEVNGFSSVKKMVLIK